MKFTSSSSVAFSEHDFNLKKKNLNKTYGKYNAGFVYIKFDRNGKQFLKEWIGLCKKWCEFNVEKNKFSDQKYLENLKIKIKNVKILNNPGINLAPWNLESKKVTLTNELNNSTGDYTAITALSAQLASVTTELEAAELRWLELSEKL